jgi:hypothetical protein
VVVLLDDSGSMATCWPWAGPPKSENCPGGQNPPSDSQNLRYSAVRLLAQLANSEDSLAVVRFAADTQGVIGQLQRVGNPTGRQALVDALKPPTDYITNGGYTRLDLALAQAQKVLAADKDSNRPRYVLLLTDGVPTQPDGVPDQGKAVRQTMADLGKMGAQVLPVLLCNDKAGCPDDTFIKQNMGTVPAKAKSAEDLLQVFSSLFSQMEPGLHVVEGNGGVVEFNIKPEHGARRLVIVADKEGLQTLKRDGNPQAITSASQDDNVLINTVEGSGLSAGKWTAETSGRGAFAVVQTDTYPELVFPPSSVAGSGVAPYYVPAGKPVAILADVAGPGAGASVRMADGSALKPFAPGSKLLWNVLPAADENFSLQVGDDQAPLQIVRPFRLQARTDLPTALAQYPAPGATCTGNQPCPFKVALGPGADVSEAQAMVYVTDQSDGGKLAYSAPMACAGRTCTDAAQDFERLDGHRYNARFFVQAKANGVVFGDWAESTLAVGPAIGVRGLPPVLNLKNQPAGGWPITVTVGTTEDLGQLRATLVLTRTEDHSTVPDAQVSLSAGLAPGAGPQATRLRVNTPAELRPGHYEGQIAFAADKAPGGEPVQLPAPVAVSLALARPAGELLDHSIDFGTTLFDTSPNFRLKQSASVGVKFAAAPFALVPTLTETSCPDLSVAAAAPVAEGDHYRVDLTLSSAAPVMPQTCTGTLALAGPSEDYEIQGAPTLAWRVAVPEATWQLTGIEAGAGGSGASRSGDLPFGSLGRPGERSRATLVVHYTGQPPFTLALKGLAGQAGGSARLTLGTQDVALVTGEITPQPGAANTYRVPVELVISRALPQVGALATWLSGTDYSGQLQLDIAGLPAPAPRPVSFRLHNPSLYQRYIAPIYTWWWPGIVTCPLSILLPLLVLGFVWLRKKDADVERLLADERDTRPSDSNDGRAGAESRPDSRPESRPAPAPGGPATSPAYMLYGRPTAKGAYQVPQRPPRSADKPAPGVSSTNTTQRSRGTSEPPASGPKPAAPPTSIPPRPPRRTK